MKYLLILILATGCSTTGVYKTQYFEDTKNGNDKDAFVIQDRGCRRVESVNVGRHSVTNNYDMEYYYSCMEKAGYKLKEKQSSFEYTNFNPFSSGFWTGKQEL